MKSKTGILSIYKSFFGWIDHYNGLILLLFLPVFLFLTPQQSWVLLLLPILWGISWLAGNKILVVTPLNGILLLMGFQILVSLYASYDLAISMPKIAGLLYSIALFFALVKFNSYRKAVLLTTVLFGLAGLGMSVLSFFGTSWATSKISTFNPIYALIPKLGNLLPGFDAGFHPNEVAGALVWVLPLWVILFGWLVIRASFVHASINSWLHALSILSSLLAIIVIAAVTFLTQSRSAYLGVLISLLIMFLFLLRGKWRWIYLVTLISVSGLVIYLDLIPQFLTWLGSRYPETILSVNAFSFDTLNGRVKIWSRALIAIQDFSFSGMGMNTFRYLVHRLYPLAPVIPGIAPKDLGHAHNEFLQSALDLGIPGMIAFIALNISAGWMSIATILHLQKPHRRSMDASARVTRELYLVISLGLLGGFLGHFIFGITDAISLGAKPGFLFWMLLSLITAIYIKSMRHDFT